MTAPVSQLLVRIAADTGALVRGGRQSERALDKVGKRAGAATKQLAALGVAAAAAGAAAMLAFSRQAIAAALIGSIESATHAFNWGTKIGGPVLGAAFAAAATAAQVANSQQTLLVQGIDANSLWRGDNVRDLAERLIEFQENGGRVVVQ